MVSPQRKISHDSSPPVPGSQGIAKAILFICTAVDQGRWAFSGKKLFGKRHVNKCIW